MAYYAIRGWLRGSFLIGVMLLLARPAFMLAQSMPTALPDKLAPTLRLLAERQAAGARQNVRVSVTNRPAFIQWAQQELPGAHVQAEPTQPALVLISGLTHAQLQVVLASPLVTFVDVPNRPAHDERQLNRANPTVNSIAAVHRRYPRITGEGLTVSVKENMFDPTDIDFKGRVVEVNANATRSEHATIMATLIAGGGNSAPSGKGAAWQARIASADYANLLPEEDALLARQGVSVQNHSYGTAIENYYGLESQAYDAQSRRNPTLLHVFSSGNSGNQTGTMGSYQGLNNVANLTGQFKMSKNTLSVGATDALGQVAPLSSRGPAYDGRIKPELVAFGDDGSSDAAALISGISLLAQQAYRDQHNGALPPASLVKAALLNSADDLGRPEVDFVAGFGQADALGTVRTLLDGRYKTGAVEQGEVEQFVLVAPPGAHHLKLTLTWTDPEAAPNAQQALINDLDIELVELTDRDEKRWFPWALSSFPHLDSLALPARRRPDHLNNVEQITLPAAQTSRYVVLVRGFNVAVGPQAFSVAYEFEGGLEWTLPLQTRSFQPGTIEQVRWQWSGPATTARLDFRPIGASAWQTISSSLDLAQRSYAWAVPTSTTLAQLRLTTTGGTAYLSDTFAIARPLALQVGYACADETLLYWNQVPGATGYRVSRLGAKQLEPFLLATDTAFVLPKAQQNIFTYYAVEPVFRASSSGRGTTVDVANTGLNCYLRSFVPRQTVADTAQLLLELGSTFRLQAVSLQRREQGEFRTIQTLSQPIALSSQLTDLDAATGFNEYRVLFQDTRGRAFYSQNESVYVVRRNDLLVFPVPVTAGEPLRIIGEPGVSLHLELYDGLGRALREATVQGTINTFDTAGLRAGVYLLRARTATGATITRRIIVL
ncbi:S8 family serine peptidase [Hymenobacter tibetensis]|uniref:S8 family serine peptidase n=1 Tax=Hymenobacter tibetensis TaxID=497967 RepID=A0ABY4CUY1_9BACT|nr:S8 family serine peptidase [Hymenobacter tibetensis]UOG74073.1 S8 family serine peptidase [Hymenobacter tibetensis]